MEVIRLGNYKISLRNKSDITPTMDPLEAMNFVLDPRDDNKFNRVLQNPKFPRKFINHHLAKDISAEYQQPYLRKEATAIENAILRHFGKNPNGECYYPDKI